MPSFCVIILSDCFGNGYVFRSSLQSGERSQSTLRIITVRRGDDKTSGFVVLLLSKQQSDQC